MLNDYFSKLWQELEDGKEKCFKSIEERNKELCKVLDEHELFMAENEKKLAADQKAIDEALTNINKMLDLL